MPAPTGSLFIPNDKPAKPGYILSAVDGSILAMPRFPPGEFGDSMPTGEFCVQDDTDDDGIVSVYTSQFVLIATHDFGEPIMGIKSDRASLFYIVTKPTTFSQQRKVYTISKAGVVGGTVWTLPGTPDASVFAVTRDGSVLYYTKVATDEPIHAYNLLTSTALTDLHAGFSGERPFALGDGYVAADGSILFGYATGLGVAPFTVRRFSAAGAVLNTYDLTHVDWDDLDHFALWSDSPSTFVAWAQNSAGTLSAFQFVRISDGVVVNFFGNIPTNTSGGTATAIPNSCPQLVLMQPYQPAIPGCAAQITPPTVSGSPGCADDLT